jgi:phosphatidylglycerophosphatase A
MSARGLATLWGVGRAPRAPGTWGSLAALLPGYALAALGGPWALAAGIVALAALGTWAAHIYLRDTGRHDPPEVVVDEALGVWMALLPLAALDALSPLSGGAALALFRLFDITKLWPVCWAERALPGAWGVMADDAVAGAWAAVLLTGGIYAGWL